MRSATTSRGATWDLMQPCAHSSPNIYSPLIKYQHYKSISFKLIRAGPPLGGPALRARNKLYFKKDLQCCGRRCEVIDGAQTLLCPCSTYIWHQICVK